MSLFHYTDAAAVLSMIQNLELWLTDIRFMNDSEESIDGANYLVEAIQEQNSPLRLHSDLAGEQLRGFSAQDVMDGLVDEHAFICSFSKTPDHLVQWRSYGLYAIELSQAAFFDLGPIHDCIYDVQEKKAAARAQVESTRRGLQAAFDVGYIASSVPVEELMWKLADVAHRFKHPSFKDENESRMIRLVSSNSNQVSYRVRGDQVIPFLKIKFLLRHVVAIHVGPMKHQDLAVASMKSFIQNFELNNTEGRLSRPIQVIPSAIPYRKL